ncbi:hypothetical protein ACFFJY_17135 [Fictibacillus aquaticus]|uniref:Uncharacterized protein n=1 Tax=Fictibacillus aquaticus TaxID=2021314 RepID=A0A235F663_9BACL|nr:hypothetical protein [Fictibacillus aquaticus]OYD56732.1 hypothetical protein CGZ90_17130 [Fictibacillus aquaticus]
MRKLADSKSKKSQIENKIKKLVKKLNNELDKAKKKAIRKELKILENKLVSVKREIYKYSYNPKRDEIERKNKEELIKKKEEEERLRLIQEDLKNRAQKTPYVRYKKVKKIKSNKVCPSCNTPFNFNFGFQRCRCS